LDVVVVEEEVDDNDPPLVVDNDGFTYTLLGEGIDLSLFSFEAAWVNVSNSMAAASISAKRGESPPTLVL
jgi:hypothetical protein